MGHLDKATPRPWRVSEFGTYIEAFDGEATIAQLMGFDGDRQRPRVDDHANADLIVAAVNSHDDLIKALEKVTNALAEASRGEMRFTPVLSAAREAIAKAGGK